MKTNQEVGEVTRLDWQISTWQHQEAVQLEMDGWYLEEQWWLNWPIAACLH